jgi:hypothetical protein
MSALEIVLAIVAGVALFTLVYALIRLPWRLRQGDVDPIGRDSDVFRRDKHDG